MIVSLMNKNSITSVALPEKVRGQFSINNDNVHIEIEGIENKWVLKSNKKAKVLDEGGNVLSSQELVDLSIYNLKVLNTSEKNFIFTEPSTNDRIEFKKYLVRNDISIKIGRKQNNDIVINNKYVSASHANIILQNGQWILKDLKSSNGTYVNGNRTGECRLKIGDIVFIMGTMIIIGKNMIAINNPRQTVSINNPLLINYFMQLQSDSDDDFDFEDIDDNAFSRSPRFKRDIETAIFKIDSPPASPIGDEMPIMMTIGPSLTMGMASMATAIYGLAGGNIMSAITSGCMLLGTVLWPIISKKYDKKRKNQKEQLRKEKYNEYLKRIRDSLEEECKKQREIITENNVNIRECRNRVESVSRNLWERSYGQNDFLSIGIGRGSVPLDAKIEYPERKFAIERDSLEEELLNMCEAPHTIDNVPITVSFFENNITGIIGPRNDVINFANGLIMQFSALYSYDEVKFVFLYDEKTADEEKLKYVKWLPHIWNDDKSIRFLAKNSDDIKNISSFLNYEFESRKERKDGDLEEITPYYIVFAFSKDLSLRADVLENIYKSKKNLHFSVIAFFDELKNLPKECSNVIQINKNSGRIFDKNDISGKVIEFVPDIYVCDKLEKYSTCLSNIHLNTNENTYKLPNMVTFLEMFGVGKIEYLNILNRWKENDPTKSLEAQIGVDTIGDLFKLDLHEKYQGPHGLVAGMTGSGKSEFIMTYILSLAVNYHPYEVAFVLIDYKGGGMAKAFEKLPHTAGIITNLDGAAINRSLISIQSELRRRQSIFAQASKNTGISNIDIYKYQKMYRDGTVDEPLQHLFIISDEFAELKTQQPEFMTQLVSAARIGRSLGVHLILATQKPSGVVDDQIWSNAKFKACLKVQDKADSMDMLKRPEAAELQQTGRFYLQVGYNELFKMGQSAWSGAPYYPSDKVEQEIDDSVDVIDNIGRVIGSAKANRKKTVSNPKKQIDAITDYLSEIAKQENIKVRSLWLDPIPSMIYVDDLIEKYGYAKKDGVIEPVIGEFDDPMNQRQSLLTVPITESGNIVVYGMAGSGKTTFITSMLYALLKNYTPLELNVYILDFSSETLTSFSKAPHVGDVVLSHEKEKVTNLIKLLLGQVQKRKKLFADFGGDIKSYNDNNEEKVPSIIVIINNYTAFSEIYEDYENDMLNLTREGIKYGIYFILTATAMNSIRFRMQQNLSKAYALQLTDETDYSAIFGKTEGLIPSKFKGRGLCKNEAIYEFQIAHAFKESNQFLAVRNFCDELKKQYPSSKAKNIPVLPDQVDMEFIEPYVNKSSLKIPVGVETNSLEVNYFDFGKSYISFIQSEEKAYTEFASTLASIISDVSMIKTTVFDPSGIMLNNGNVKVINSKKETKDEVDSLFATVLERHNTIKDSEDEDKSIPQYPLEVYVITSLADLRAQLDDKLNEKLTLILEKGSKKLNIFIIIAESSKSISSYSFEKWFKTNSSQGDGIWIGNGISDQYYIKLIKTTSDMSNEVTAQYGYSVNNGKATKIKVIGEFEED